PSALQMRIVLIMHPRSFSRSRPGLDPAQARAKLVGRMLINCVVYRQGVKLADIKVEQIREHPPQPDTFVWVALRNATDAELAAPGLGLRLLRLDGRGGRPLLAVRRRARERAGGDRGADLRARRRPPQHPAALRREAPPHRAAPRGVAADRRRRQAAWRPRA